MQAAAKARESIVLRINPTPFIKNPAGIKIAPGLVIFFCSTKRAIKYYGLI